MKPLVVNFMSRTLALCCTTIAGCGVKSAPTPALPSPPGPLQREAEQRALLRKEKDKQKREDTEKGSK